MPVGNTAQAGVEDAFVPRNEEQNISSGVVAISEVLSFVVEFKANVEIFSQAATMVTLALVLVDQLKNTVGKQAIEITVLRDEDKKIWAALQRLSGLQPGNADSPAVTRPPQGEGPIKSGNVTIG
jgi:hypothetical protein